MPSHSQASNASDRGKPRRALSSPHRALKVWRPPSLIGPKGFERPGALDQSAKKARHQSLIFPVSHDTSRITMPMGAEVKLSSTKFGN